MKVIIKSDRCVECYKADCSHSRPSVKGVKLGKFQVWQERTCSLATFDKTFGSKEGTWLSNGTEHCEIGCGTGCHGWDKEKPHKHCRRRMKDARFWYVDFSSLEQLEEFIRERGYVKVFVEEQDGVGITIEL